MENPKEDFMRKIIMLLVGLFILTITSCELPLEEKYPCLEIVNMCNCDVVTKVSLVGYTFDSLNIEYGESQKFYLTNGMPAGYENINVAISAKRHITLNKKCTFSNGKITIAKYDL